MAEIAADPNAGIMVYMPFVLDVSGVEAELFGEEYALTGTDVPVQTRLATASFYDEANGGKAWLHYIQGADEDNFDVYVNREKSAELIADISGALKIEEGSVYQAALQSSVLDGSGNLDAALVFTSVDAMWKTYHSLQDFVISWYANKILGHPAALAAISNDAHIRSEVGAKFAEGITALHGVDDYAFTDLESLDVSGADGRTSLAEMTTRTAPTDGPANGMAHADLQLIVQQVMNLAPGRFNSSVDRGYLAPLKWYGQDQIVIQLNIDNAKYRVATNPTNSTRPNDSRAVGGVYKNLAAGAGQTYNLDSESFKLIFTLQ